jgi:hypothetical protein
MLCSFYFRRNIQRIVHGVKLVTVLIFRIGIELRAASISARLLFHL